MRRCARSALSKSRARRTRRAASDEQAVRLDATDSRLPFAIDVVEAEAEARRKASSKRLSSSSGGLPALSRIREPRLGPRSRDRQMLAELVGPLLRQTAEQLAEPRTCRLTPRQDTRPPPESRLRARSQPPPTSERCTAERRDRLRGRRLRRVRPHPNGMPAFTQVARSRRERSPADAELVRQGSDRGALTGRAAHRRVRADFPLSTLW